MFKKALKKTEGIIDIARKSIHVSRKLIDDVKSIIDIYVKKHNLIISNISYLDGLGTSHPPYIIYGGDIFMHANNLSNEISKLNIYTVLYTNMKNKDYTITVEGNGMAQLFNVWPNVLKSILPLTIKGIQVYPPELELINIYHQLYLPNFVCEWDNLACSEQVIVKKLKSRRKILGGKEGKKRKKMLFDNKVLLEWLKRRDDCVLVGINAIDILLKKTPSCNISQVITDAPHKIVDGVKRLLSNNLEYDIRVKKYNIHMYLEPRLIKTVISITFKDGKLIHILDIFNSATYELVPYSTIKDINIGFKYVIKMHILVDMWFLRILNTSNILNNSSLRISIDRLFKYFDLIDGIDETIYVTEEHIGRHEDIVIYKKKIGTQNSQQPYIPEYCRYRNGSYRIIHRSSG